MTWYGATLRPPVAPVCEVQHLVPRPRAQQRAHAGGRDERVGDDAARAALERGDGHAVELGEQDGAAQLGGAVQAGQVVEDRAVGGGGGAEDDGGSGHGRSVQPNTVHVQRRIMAYIRKLS